MQMTYSVIGIMIGAILLLALPVSYKVRHEMPGTFQLREAASMIGCSSADVTTLSLFAAGD